MTAWTLAPGSCTPSTGLRGKYFNLFLLFAKVKLWVHVTKNILTGGEAEENNETEPHKLCQVSKYNLGGNETHVGSKTRTPTDYICFQNILLQVHVCVEQTTISAWLMTSDRLCLSPGWAESYLLDHDDIRAEHFKAPSEEHDVAPSQNQTQCHHHSLSLHLTGSEHAQQHHQAGVANTGQKTCQGLNSKWFRAVFDFTAWKCFDSQDNMEGASQCCLAEVALCPHSQYIWDLSEEEIQGGEVVRCILCTVCGNMRHVLVIHLQQ